VGLEPGPLNLYPWKLALTSPTSDGHSIGTVHSRTKAKLFSLFGVISQKAEHLITNFIFVGAFCCVIYIYYMNI
jgi:hypothetical protein